MKTHLTAVGIATLTLLAPLAAPSSHAASSGAKSVPAISPDAISALQKMGDFLRKQQMFSVQARMTTDDALKSGQKVQYGGNVDLKIRRPDRLRMDISGDRRNERIYYNGKNYTTTAQYDDPSTDLRIFKISGTFSSYAQIYTGTSESGKRANKEWAPIRNRCQPSFYCDRKTNRGDWCYESRNL